MSRSKRQIPNEPGSYLLGLYLRRRTAVQVGRLGRFEFQRGWYYYCGSAFGPGGLRARLKHHLQPLTRRHWHIDYLRSVARPRWLAYRTGHNFEHRWSDRLSRCPGAATPVSSFGASDCSCRSHLVYFARQLDWSWLVATDDSFALAQRQKVLDSSQFMSDN